MNKKISPMAGAEQSFNDEYTPIQPIDANISVCKNAKDNTGTVSTIRKQLEIIRTGKLSTTIEKLRACSEDEYSARKIWLPMAIFQGTFEPTRKAENIQKSSGLMIVDLDHLTDNESEALREKLRSCPFIFAAWRSPRNGVKALFRVDFSNDAEFKAAYRAIAAYLHTEFSLEIDPTGKDVSRGCFTSADSKLWTNASAEKFCYSMPEAEPVAAATRKTPVVIAIRSNPRLEGYVLAAINSELNNIGNAPKGNGTASLYRAAIRAGELSHTGLYSRSAVEDHFIQEFLNRKHSHNSPEHARVTFNNGWTLGESQPRQLPEEVLK
ncbi:MAG TPA: BT4734/BF3469 family protein [Candidatus Rifleibacterium sp.]|nr:BT4734/BF3469 family protein [Candidatus Rifleibacterium sp.]HPT45565.1 BT4734/BF3469 family protein [Candidatus Rifleibacterium sp.]